MNQAGDFVPGDASGLALPAHAEALMAAGADFLTQAFRAFGVLGAGNRVTAITARETVGSGNSGHKLALTVAYAQPSPDLAQNLFVKFSRDFTDPFRDRRRHELEAEVRLAELSRHPAFPVPVARAMFADFHRESGTGLLISECIPFGEGAIEPLRPKCMDHELADPAAYYRATLSALARLAAAHLSGCLSPEVERLFPYDRAVAEADPPVAWDEAGLCAAVDRLRAFAAQCPRLLPAHLRAPAFHALLEDEAIAILRRLPDVRRFLQSDPRLVALCHWNTNLDNAWFWREVDGTVRCGLLDWGMVRPMNLAYGIWGGLSAADPAMLDAHLDDLLALFAAELAAHGGPAVDPETLGRHFDLSLALLGLALMMDVPALIRQRMPDTADLSGPRDPRLAQDGVARGFLLVFTNFLSLWERRHFAQRLNDLPPST